MLKMEKRLSTVENNYTILKDFLRKEFGSRFVDYIAKRGVQNIGNNLSSSNNFRTTMSTKTNSRNKSSAAYHPRVHQPVKIQPAPAPRIADYLTVGVADDYYEEGDEDMEEHSADPLAFVEIVDDEKDNNDGTHFELEDDEDNYEINPQPNQQYYGGVTNYQESDQLSENLPYDIRIIDCRSELNNGTGTKQFDNHNPTFKFKSVSSRGRAAARKHTGVKKVNVEPYSSQVQRPQLKPRPPQGVKRLLQPKVKTEQSPQLKISDLLEQDNVEYISLPGTSSSITSLEEDGIPIGGSGEGSGEGGGDSLREHYHILPDKSVQCRICQKILKAGWHKFGRHYRTHTGEKPFACEHCGERFARKDNMHNHIKSKHPPRFPLETGYVSAYLPADLPDVSFEVKCEPTEPEFVSAYLPEVSFEVNSELSEPTEPHLSGQQL